jgi:hypothetical protein
VQCANGVEATGDSSGGTLGDIVGNLLDCGGPGNGLPEPLWRVFEREEKEGSNSVE